MDTSEQLIYEAKFLFIHVFKPINAERMTQLECQYSATTKELVDLSDARQRLAASITNQT